MINFIIVRRKLKFAKNTILMYVDDFSALFRQFISGFWPKFSVGLMMIDFILVTGVSKFVKNTISQYVNDFSALFRRFISKNSLFSLNWAKKGGF